MFLWLQIVLLIQRYSQFTDDVYLVLVLLLHIVQKLTYRSYNQTFHWFLHLKIIQNSCNPIKQLSGYLQASAPFNCYSVLLHTHLAIHHTKCRRAMCKWSRRQLIDCTSLTITNRSILPELLGLLCHLILCLFCICSHVSAQLAYLLILIQFAICWFSLLFVQLQLSIHHPSIHHFNYWYNNV